MLLNPVKSKKVTIMTQENQGQKKQLPFPSIEAMEVMAYIEEMKDKLSDHGVSWKVIDQLKFDVGSYVIKDASCREMFNSASRYFADGEQFFEISITTDASMREGVCSADKHFLAMPEKTQQVKLAAEIVLETMTRVEDALPRVSGARLQTGPAEMEGTPFKATICTRRDLTDFFRVACDILESRLPEVTGKHRPMRDPSLPSLG